MFVNIRNWDIPLQIVRGRLSPRGKRFVGFRIVDGESGECKDTPLRLSTRRGSLDFQKLERSGREKVRYGSTHFNHVSAAGTQPSHSRKPPWGAWRARCGESKFASVYFLRKEERGWTMERFSTLRNVFVNIHPTHEAARAASSSSCRSKSLCININASSACTTYSRPPYSAGSPRRRKHESSTEFTAAPTRWTRTSSQYLRSVSPFSLSAPLFLVPLSPPLPSLVRVKRDHSF